MKMIEETKETKDDSSKATCATREQIAFALKKAADGIDGVQRSLEDRLTAKNAETLQYISEREREKLDSLVHKEQILTKVIRSLKHGQQREEVASASSSIVASAARHQDKYYSSTSSKNHSKTTPAYRNKELELVRLQQNIKLAKDHATKHIQRHHEVQPNLEKLNTDLNELKCAILQEAENVTDATAFLNTNDDDGSSVLNDHLEDINEEYVRQRGAERSSVQLKNEVTALSESYKTKRRQSQLALGSSSKSAMRMKERLLQLQKQGSTLRRQEIDAHMENVKLVCVLELDDLRTRIRAAEEELENERKAHPILVSDLNSKISCAAKQMGEATVEHRNDQVEGETELKATSQQIEEANKRLNELKARISHQDDLDRMEQERLMLKQKQRLADIDRAERKVVASNNIKRIIRRFLKRKREKEKLALLQKGKKKKKGGKKK